MFRISTLGFASRVHARYLLIGLSPAIAIRALHLAAVATVREQNAERRSSACDIDEQCGVDGEKRAGQAIMVAKDESTMNDEKPKKPRRSAGPRGTRKGADTVAPSTTHARATTENPAIAIEHSSEIATPPTEDAEEIRRQAYELYLARGGVGGDDLSDWLEAERIVRTRRGSSGDGARDRA